MSSKLSRRYQLKKALLWPRTVFMRWKCRNFSEPMKALLERHYYRAAVFDFIAATQLNQYILHEASIDSDSVVLDVGAATGNWAQHMVERYNPVIYAFEPAADSFAKLREKAVDNPKFQPMPYGLGHEDGAGEDARRGELVSSPTSGTDSKTDVKIAAVDRVWKDLKLGQVDLMRINIEGAEFSLLDKMIGADLLNKVNCFMIQFHEPHSGAYRKRLRIREELSKTHRLEWNYDFIWEKWVRI
jgi:FkbM family methyltransferase